MAKHGYFFMHNHDGVTTVFACFCLMQHSANLPEHLSIVMNALQGLRSLRLATSS